MYDKNGGKEVVTREAYLNKIRKMDFEKVEVSEFFSENETNSSYRLTDKNISAMPNETTDITLLRVRLSDLFHERVQNYTQLELNCDIKRDSFQKALRCKNGRNIKYKFLAKFCIGAKLSVEETKELFLLMGHELSERSRYDYILLCEIENGGSIEDYNQDLIDFGYESIFSKDYYYKSKEEADI